MRLSATPDNPLERLAMLSGQVPTPLVLATWGMGVSRVLIVSARLGVFEALGRSEGMTAAELSEAIGCHPVGTEALLNALNGFGYLRRREGRYRNAPIVDKWLLPDSKRSMHHALLFLQDVWDQLDMLEGALKTGEMRRFHEAEMPAGFWDRYMRGLGTMAKVLALEVSRKIRVPKGATRLLDVGGGHGMFSVGLCRRHEGLQATVLDLPQAAAIGRELVAEEGMAERVRYQEGDLRTVDWGQGHDVVLIFNVLHNSSDEEGAAVVQKAYHALRPGGLLAVLDSEHRQQKGDLSFTGAYNELFFFLVSGTRAWPEATMRGWMEAAGFQGLRVSRTMMMPEVLLQGVRPAEE